jgi:membrane-bound metal-dependent hydrolase YbcI (DUF457 family)
VDVVSHLAFGRALAALAHRPTDRDRAAPPRRRALTAAIVIGAIAPDVDAVLMPFGWDRYLVSHERGTHTLLGTLVVAALLACAIRYVVQPLLRRPRTPWRLLWLAALTGCASHLLLDAVCGGSLHMLWPLSDARLTFSLVGMADPLLAGPLLLFLIAALIWRRHAFTLAIALLIAMTGVLAAKLVSRQAARHAYEHAMAALSEPPLRSTPPLIEARWASLTEWYIYDRTSTHVRAWRVDAQTARVELYLERAATLPADPTALHLLDASRQLDTTRRALNLFEFAVPELINRPDGTIEVFWSDIRYCRPSTCDLRFGGRFDRTGRPLEQVILIGTVRQTRQP